MIDVIKKFEKTYPRLSEILRFLIIGGVSTLIDFFVMSLVIYLPNKAVFGYNFLRVFTDKNLTLTRYVVLGTAIGFIVGLVFNYIFSLIFVYKKYDDSAKTKKGFFLFLFFSLIGLIIQTLGVFVGFKLFKINEWIVKIVFVIVVLIFNYFTRKKYIFGKSSETYEKEEVPWSDKEIKKLEFISFALLFVFYLCLGLICCYYSNGVRMEYLFGTDSSRVMSDWTSFSANHYRTKVHPLYVLLIYPIISILKLFGCDAYLAVVIFIALISTLNSFFVYKIFKKLNFNKPSIVVILFTLFYALSFSTIQNSLVCESFVCGAFSLIVMTYWAVSIYKREYTLKDYLIFILMFVLTFSMVTTNVFIFLIFGFYLFVLKKITSFKDFCLKALKFCFLVAISLLICYLLCFIQTLIFESSENAISYTLNMIKDIIYGTNTTEEFSYTTSSPFAFSNILDLIVTFFGFNICGGKLDKTNLQWTLKCSIFNYLFTLFFIIYFVYSIVSSIKKKNYIVIPVALAYLFECGIHLIYGYEEKLLYPINSLFLLIVVFYLGYISSDLKTKKWFNLSILAILSLSILQSIFTNVQIVFSIVEKFGLSGRYIIKNNGIFVLFFVLAICLCFILPKFKDKKYFAKLLVCFVMLLWVTLSITVRFPLNIKNHEEYDDYKILFGMGQREKYVFTYDKNMKGNFSKYDVSTKKSTIIYNDLLFCEYDAENYVITCKNKNDESISIYENENGIYAKKDGKVETIDELNHINIPTFDGYTYKSYLKILFHEVLVNALPTGLTPNYVSYGNVWYRDSAIMAMVFEKTGNKSQVKISINPNDVYDNARGGVKEPDNLGEALYLLSLQDQRDEEAINAIILEAQRIKQSDNCIHGITDGGELYVYQTIWLKYGLECLGINSDEYDVTGKYDIYADMCWFYTRSNPSQFNEDKNKVERELFDIKKNYYPYLTIAKLHYYQVKIDIPDDLSYPISFEYQDWGLPRKQKCSPHGWTAAELFLYLLDYDTF